MFEIYKIYTFYQNEQNETLVEPKDTTNYADELLLL